MGGACHTHHGLRVLSMVVLIIEVHNLSFRRVDSERDPPVAGDRKAPQHLPGTRGRFGALRRKFQNRLNLLPRHAEFFHQLVNAHTLKILEHGGDRACKAN